MALKRKHFTAKRVSSVLIILGITLLLVSFGPLIHDEVWYFFKQLRGVRFILPGETPPEEKESVFGRLLPDNNSVFGNLMSSPVVVLSPVNTDFAIVIEKIGVNAPIVADVPTYDTKAYEEALKTGVAHALVSDYPSETPGNVYLFAHTSLNFWDLGKYATVFNLLRKLDIGDTVHIFFRGRDFVYTVVNKEVMSGWNTYPLTRPVIEPILTLQTCDPPGTTLNRLVVTAKLREVK